MRRIVLLVTAVMAMAAVMAMTARADEPGHPGDCRFERGKTYCTERERIDDITEVIDEVSYFVECPPERGDFPVLEETYRTYEVYRVTETTYAGKSEHVLDWNTRTERGLYYDFVLTTGGCSG